MALGPGQIPPPSQPSLNTYYQTLTIVPGQTVYIPKGAIILGKETTGDADVTSECIDTTVETITCHEFAWELSPGSSEQDPFEVDNVRLKGIGIGTTSFYAGDVNIDDVASVETFLSSTPLNMFMKDRKYYSDDEGNVRGQGICFKSPSSVGLTLYLRLSTVRPQAGTDAELFFDIKGRATLTGMCNCD